MSKSTKSRSRQLSRAELKAYEARRAAEANRTVPDVSNVVSSSPRQTVVSTVRRPRALSRDEEFAIIRADLRRLLLILALLAVILVVLTFVLR